MGYGFDPSMLLQTQGVQVPDPVKMYATSLSLGDLARRGQMDDLQIQAARKAQAAGDAYDAALPGLVQSGFTTDSIVSAINQNPRAAGMILKESDARKKAALDQGKTAAETAKLEGETRKMDLAMVGGMGHLSSAILGATIVTNKRKIAADDFFKGLFETALEEREVITAISFPKAEKAAYMKFPNPASRYAIVAVMVAKTASPCGWPPITSFAFTVPPRSSGTPP